MFFQITQALYRVTANVCVKAKVANISDMCVVSFVFFV